MHPRQKELLKNIVEEYVSTVTPVGSKLLVEKFHMDISPATVRNDMAELEDLGLIRQPHTSAGRIPTEDGYKYYVENFVKLEKELDEKDKQEIKIKVNKDNKNNFEEEVKSLAKVIAERSNQGIIVGFPNHDVYYTGLSNLFSQSEFHDLDLISDMSNVFDHLDEIISDIFDDFSDQAEIMIGGQEIFPNDCSMVVTKNKDVLFGIIGPTRMDYGQNIALVNFVRDLLSKNF